MDIQVEPIIESRLTDSTFDSLLFGVEFSDHMLLAQTEQGQWGDATILPYGNLSVPPSLSVFHYGQAVFEGMKAFYVDESTVHLFRLDDHYERLKNSCHRISIPVPPKEMFIEGLKKLVDLDRRWVPNKENHALYIRPVAFASDPIIAAKASTEYTFMIICSPVGPYYPTGVKPLDLTTSTDYVRAVVGGTGYAKAAGNYAASFQPAKEVREDGFAQIIWLDALDHKYVEEVGTMNIFFKLKDRLITPTLTGSILPGITRSSVIQLAREMDIEVSEERIDIHDMIAAYKSGDLEEVFGAGTAAVIAPIGRIHHQGENIQFTIEGRGPFATKIHKAITDLQYGRIADTHGWVHPV